MWDLDETENDILKEIDDFPRVVASADQVGQEAHGFVDVAEEVLVAGAQVV